MLERPTATKRELITLIIGVILTILGKVIPPFGPVTEEGVLVLFTFIALIVVMLRDGDIWTTLIIMFLFSFFGKQNFGNTVITGMMSNNIIWMLFFMFWFLDGVRRSGLINWMVKALLKNNLVKKGPYYLVAVLMFTSFFVAAVTQGGGVVAVIMIAVLNSIARQINLPQRSSYVASTAVGIALATIMGGLGVPYSGVVYLLKAYMGQMGGGLQNVFQTTLICWLAFILYLIIHICLVKFIIRPKVDKDSFKVIEMEDAGKMTATMKQTIGALLVLVVLIAGQSLIPATTPVGALFALLGQSGPFAAALLIMVLIKDPQGAYLFNFREKMNQSTNWKALMVPAAMLYVMSFITGNMDNGIFKLFMALVAPFGGLAPWLFLLIALLVATLLTNFTNNVLIVLVFTPIGGSIFANDPKYFALYMLGVAFAETLALAVPSGGYVSMILHANKEGLIESNDIVKWGLLLSVLQILCVYAFLMIMPGMWTIS